MNAASLHRRSCGEKNGATDQAQLALRRVSLAEGSAPIVYRRGTQTGGLSLRAEAALPSIRAPPGPPHAIEQPARSGMVRDPQGPLAEGSAPMVYRRGTQTGGLSLRAEAALPSIRAPPGPSHAIEQPARSGMVRDPQGPLAEGSAPMVYRRDTQAGGLSLRSEAALRPKYRQGR